MNNNLNLINQVGRTYNLTPEQFNLLTTKYQNDPRDQLTIQKELTNICDYYRFQNNLNQKIASSMPLPNGKN